MDVPEVPVTSCNVHTKKRLEIFPFPAVRGAIRTGIPTHPLLNFHFMHGFWFGLVLLAANTPPPAASLTDGRFVKVAEYAY
jgi:hypothetical protein